MDYRGLMSPRRREQMLGREDVGNENSCRKKKLCSEMNRNVSRGVSLPVYPPLYLLIGFLTLSVRTKWRGRKLPSNPPVNIIKADQSEECTTIENILILRRPPLNKPYRIPTQPQRIPNIQNLPLRFLPPPQSVSCTRIHGHQCN